VRKTLLSRGALTFDSTRGVLLENGEVLTGARNSGLERFANQLISDGYRAPQQALSSNVGVIRRAQGRAGGIPRDGQVIGGPGNVRVFEGGWVEFDVRYDNEVIRMRAAIDRRATLATNQPVEFETMFPIGARPATSVPTLPAPAH
jgi:hypothetical protein